MISEEEARAQILAAVRPLPPAEVSLGEALDRFAAGDVVASVPLPPFDNSAMDGYAVVASGGKRLRVIGEQAAGADRRLRVRGGEAVRVFTGAPMPEGADAVVMQEDVTREGDEIVLNEAAAAGEFIRRKGCDLVLGQKILRKGERLRPQTLALLASQGFATVQAHALARVAIISTGDELIRPGGSLPAGQLYESNSTLLCGLVARAGAGVHSVSHAPDDPQALAATLKAALEADAVIVSGGVSVGEHDHVKSVLREVGADINLWRVAIKPGKPFLFGARGRCLIFGLPGNPVSAFVTFLQFVRPALLRMMGAADAELSPRESLCRLAADLQNSGDRPHYIRGTASGGEFAPVGLQESHALFGLSRANALVRLAPGERRAAGEQIVAQHCD